MDVEVDENVIAVACHKHAYAVGRLRHQYQHDSWLTRLLHKLFGLDAERCFAEGWAVGHAKVSGCHGC